MKKILIIILVIIVAVAIYLNRAYAHIYNMIGEKNLPNPTIQQNYFVGDAKNEKTIKILFLGDSLTAGVGASDYTKSFPHLVAEKIAQINNSQIEVLNLAEPGATSFTVLNDQINKIGNFKPELVFLWIGTNDVHNQISLSLYNENMEKIINKLKLDPKKINIIELLNLGDKKLMLWPYQDYFSGQIEHYNAWGVRLLNNSGVQILHLSSQLKNKFSNDSSLYANDLFHPNDLGYQLIANSLFTDPWNQAPTDFSIKI